MSGRRLDTDSIGDNYENCVQHLLGGIATLVRVPRERDFGIDFYCQPRIPVGPRTETVTELCAIQVKGGSAEFSFGGLKKSGDKVEWREFAFTWLKSLATPLFLAQVSNDNTTIDLYSVWWVWWIFSRQNVTPFKVKFVLGEHGTGPDNQEEPKRSESEEGKGHGDGLVWTIDAGPPFLSVNATVFADKDHVRQLVEVLRHRIAVERLMLMRFLQFIPILPAVFRHTTNTLEGVDVRAWSFWSPAPGENLGRLCNSFVPLLIGSPIRSRYDSLAFAPDGKAIAATERDRVVVYEAATGHVRHEFRGNLASVVQVEFSRDGRYLAAAGMDHTTLIWDVTGQARSWRKQTHDPSPKQLELNWTALASADHGGQDSLWSLRGAPRQVIALCKERVQPIPRLGDAEMAKLIANLDDAVFAERDKASRVLEALEEAAEPALRQAIKESASAEVRRRAEKLLEKLDGTVTGERLRVLRAIELLEHYATPEAKTLLARLADGAPLAQRTREAKASLSRLERP